MKLVELNTFTFDVHVDKANDCRQYPKQEMHHNWRRDFLTCSFVNFIIINKQKSTYKFTDILLTTDDCSQFNL